MDFRSLSLDDKERIDSIRKLAHHTASSHAFVSLYLWRNAMGLSVAFFEDAFVIKASNGYFFPCGSQNGVTSCLKEVWQDEPDARFYYARKDDLALCEEVFGESVSVEFDAASREYLYLRSEQIEMKGKKFTYQRAKVNKAKRLGEVTSCELTKALVPTAKAITEEWASRREDKGDFAETLEALDNMEAVVSHNEADLSTWIPFEYEENLVYGAKSAEWSPWTKALREQLREDSIKKLREAGK